MKICKAKTIDLLNEIKDVCEQEHIRYYISGELALSGKERSEIRDEFNNGAVAVFAEDIEKIMGLLNQKENRKIESLADNNKFPGFYVRYMDTSTTLINFTEKAFTYNTNSLGVNIEVICGRAKNGLKGKVLSKLKKMWVKENTPFYIARHSGKRTFKDKITAVFFAALKHTSIMGKLFWAWIHAGKAETTLCELATNRGEIVKYRTDIFDKTAKIELSGAEFNVVNNLTRYIDNYYDSGNRVKPVMHDIVEFDVPWNQTKKFISKYGINLTEYQNDQQEYLEWRKHEYLPVKRKKEKFNSYMFCAEDRMYFYKEFKGEKKEQILALHRAGELDALREIMSEYIEKINYYATHHVGFCSDVEIFRAAMSVMLYDEYLANNKLPDFKRRCKRLFNIINNINYRHFDSIENVFWGEREKEDVLKERKKNTRQSVVQEAKGYYEKYRTGERG